MLLAPASSEPIPAAACLDDLADSGVQLQHDTDVFGAPGVGLMPDWPDEAFQTISPLPAHLAEDRAADAPQSVSG